MNCTKLHLNIAMWVAFWLSTCRILFKNYWKMDFYNKLFLLFFRARLCLKRLMRSGFLSPGSPPDWSTPTRTSRSWLTSTYPPHPHHHHHKTGMATNAYFLFVKNPSFVDDPLNRTLRGFLSWYATLQWSPHLASYETSGTTKAPSGLLLLEELTQTE